MTASAPTTKTTAAAAALLFTITAIAGGAVFVEGFQIAPPLVAPSLTTTTRNGIRTKGAMMAPRKNAADTRSPLRLSSKPSSDEDGSTSNEHESKNLISQAYHLYVDYFDRLWEETDVTKRRRLTRQRALDAVERVRNMVTAEGGVGEEYLWAGESGDSDTAFGKMLGAKDKDGKKGKAEESVVLEIAEKSVVLEIDEEVRKKMEEACDLMIENMNKGTGGGITITEVEKEAEVGDTAVLAASTTEAQEEGNGGGAAAESSTTVSTELATTTDAAVEENPPKKKKGRSKLFGLAMGGAVACWVYSGNYVFTGLFTLMTALGQLEYYRMIMNTGIYPARRISVAGACAMFVAALFAPNLHQIVLPVFSTWAMVWFLTMRRRPTTIAEIATTFTGMFYLGYIPSFWVRIRLIGANREATRLAPLVKPLFERFGSKLPTFLPKAVHLPITTGSNFIFWTWLCIAFSDVGGYFFGRKFGKTKLGAISPAAGATSPNKTVEGVVGGCLFSMVLATFGAWVQKWPYWYALGPVHGVLLALLGLVGDLTASMLKRDAGLKDFGDLIPEHGGIMDRVDSYIFTAPYGWMLCGYFIPWLKTVAAARAAAAAVVLGV